MVLRKGRGQWATFAVIQRALRRQVRAKKLLLRSVRCRVIWPLRRIVNFHHHRRSNAAAGPTVERMRSTMSCSIRDSRNSVRRGSRPFRRRRWSTGQNPSRGAGFRRSPCLLRFRATTAARPAGSLAVAAGFGGSLGFIFGSGIGGTIAGSSLASAAARARLSAQGGCGRLNRAPAELVMPPVFGPGVPPG